jgi:hypothetical protein
VKYGFDNGISKTSKQWKRRNTSMAKQWGIFIICIGLWHGLGCGAEKKSFAAHALDEGDFRFNSPKLDAIYYSAFGGALGLNAFAGYCIVADSIRSQQSPMKIIRSLAAAQRWHPNPKCMPSYHSTTVGQAYRFILKNSIKLGAAGGLAGSGIAILGIGADAGFRWIADKGQNR